MCLDSSQNYKAYMTIHLFTPFIIKSSYSFTHSISKCYDSSKFSLCVLLIVEDFTACESFSFSKNCENEAYSFLSSSSERRNKKRDENEDEEKTLKIGGTQDHKTNDF